MNAGGNFPSNRAWCSRFSPAPMWTPTFSAPTGVPCRRSVPFSPWAPHARKKTVLLRKVDKDPYLPADFSEAEDALSELFSLQVHSLAARMAHIGVKKLVLGVSGGIDSTLALLVSAKALDTLELPVII